MFCIHIFDDDDGDDDDDDDDDDDVKFGSRINSEEKWVGKR